MSNNKITCLHPGGKSPVNIEPDKYEKMAAAIKNTLIKSGPIAYTELMEGVKSYFKEQQIPFEGSVNWYGVVVKNDLEARDIIETYFIAGKKVHRLR